jgi:hypothetical protein
MHAIYARIEKESAMKKIDKFLQSETVKDCTGTFRGYLPPDLRKPFDDLMELRECILPIQRDLVTDKKNLQHYSKAFSRLCVFFKDNPLIEPDESQA